MAAEKLRRFRELAALRRRFGYYVKTTQGWRCRGGKSKSEHIAVTMSAEEIAEVERLLTD